MLDAVPDRRPTIEEASDEELAEIFKAFDVSITSDKNREALSGSGDGPPWVGVAPHLI